MFFVAAGDPPSGRNLYCSIAPKSRRALGNNFEGEGRGGAIQKSMRKVKTEIASVVTELQYLFHPPLGGHLRASEIFRPTLKVDRETRKGQQGNAKRDNRENTNRTTGRTRAGQQGKRERDNREDTKGAKMKTQATLCSLKG